MKIQNRIFKNCGSLLKGIAYTIIIRKYQNIRRKRKKEAEEKKKKETTCAVTSVLSDSLRPHGL